jgi:hypothetical protein
LTRHILSVRLLSGNAEETASRVELEVPDDEVELLRSMLACAYEKSQPLVLRIIQALKKSINLGTRKKSVISLSIVQSKKDAA